MSWSSRRSPAAIRLHHARGLPCGDHSCQMTTVPTTTVTTVGPLNHVPYTRKMHVSCLVTASCLLLAVWGSGSRGGGGGVLVERLEAGRRSPFIHRQ